jgi:hypothetical protein
MNSNSELFVVAFVMRPMPASREAKQFGWALVTCWIRAAHADAAVIRARQAILKLPWNLCCSKCQVNLGAAWKKPISPGMQASIGLNLDDAVFEFDGASVGSTEPDFETLFRDPLTTKPITTNPTHES